MMRSFTAPTGVIFFDASSHQLKNGVGALLLLNELGKSHLGSENAGISSISDIFPKI